MSIIIRYNRDDFAVETLTTVSEENIFPMVNVNGRQVMMTATMTMMTMRMMMMMMLFNFAEPLAIGLLLMTIMFLYNVEMLMFKDMFF